MTERVANPAFTTIHALVHHTAPELISSVRAVREFAHGLLTLISDLTGCPVSSMLAPYRDRLTAPVLQQSLHQVPTANQIGYISAATYCLRLSPPLVSPCSPSFLLSPPLRSSHAFGTGECEGSAIPASRRHSGLR
jgi:hypothetical protein